MFENINALSTGYVDINRPICYKYETQWAEPLLFDIEFYMINVAKPFFFFIYSLIPFESSNRYLDCVGLTAPYEIAMLQDESLNLLLESCGGATRMGHILLTLPYIRAAADRKVIQV